MLISAQYGQTYGITTTPMLENLVTYQYSALHACDEKLSRSPHKKQITRLPLDPHY